MTEAQWLSQHILLSDPTGKDSPPAASLHSRPKDHKAENWPAPGDYNPEKSENALSNHDNAPKFTFGLKTQPSKPVNTPGKFTVYIDKLIYYFPLY